MGYHGTLTPTVILDYSLSSTLAADGSARFTFPASALANGFVVQASENPATGWSTGPTPTTEGDTAILSVPATAAARFYRLNRP